MSIETVATLGREGAPAVEELAHRIIETGLHGGGSVLTPGRAIWTWENLEALKRDYVDKPDMGSSGFFDKLDQQLVATPSDAVQLFAEIFLLNLLPLDDYTPGKKRELITHVLARCSPPVPIPPDVEAALARGVFSGGVAFKTRRWAQLVFLITFAHHFKTQPEAQQTEALSDPLAFRAVVRGTAGPREPAQRQSLMYLAFPKFFLPIVKFEHRRGIRNAFADEYLEGPPGDIDEDLFEINEALVAQQEAPVNYYASPWKERWQPQSAKDTDKQTDEPGRAQDVRRAWLVRGSSVNGRDLVPTWISKGSVSLAASHLRPIDEELARDELKAIVEEDYQHASYAARQEKLDEFYAFLSRMRPGDLIATVSQGQMYLGTITGDPEYVASADKRSNLRRTVHWEGHDKGIDYADLPTEVSARLNAQREVLDLTQYLDKLVALTEEEPGVVVESKVVLPAATPELAARLHVPQEWLQDCIDLLDDRPQLIFYGPPGTGKTYLARALAAHIAGDNVKLVQFHPAYSYEDFFEGYRPDQGGNGQVGFTLKPGPLRRLVDQATENPSTAHVLIIDEINRGNLAKIFGELYFLLEYRDQSIDLLYSSSDDDKGFTLPENVFIIGTMNTADRSIALVDSAMRRRFAFRPLRPTEPPTAGILRSWLQSEGRPTESAELLEELNTVIGDVDFQIGPSYFMRPAVYQPKGLERVWDTAILPLLEEHHFGDGTNIAARYGLETIRKRIAAKSGAAIADAVPETTGGADEATAATD
ncbi:AAA domain-containing protein [Rhodococcus opacus]|nr:AAA domain-containing protein [Rhodococcus opacus]CAG7641729.1 hypothetical protein E143388_08313 [Rhodococcus opacus]